MKKPFELAQVVLLEDLPTEELEAGQLGILVDDLGGGEEWAVEFYNAEGLVYKYTVLNESQFLVTLPTPLLSEVKR